MNEGEWQGGDNVAAMLDYLDGKVSDRKLRLFACACLRLRWAQLREYHTSRAAVEMAERLADGQAEAQEVEEMRQTAEVAGSGMFEQFVCMAAAAALAESAIDSARNARELCRQQAVREAAYEVAPWENEGTINAEASAVECRAQANLLREIIGNPFRPVPIDPSWLKVSGGAVRGMAEVIDSEHRFAELPYLADALMDAGCTDVVLLEHLHSPTGHMLGCWALDAILARQ